MRIEENYSLEKHNTFHLPVKARWCFKFGLSGDKYTAFL